MEGLREGVSLNIAIYNKTFMLKIVNNKMHFKHYNFPKMNLANGRVLVTFGHVLLYYCHTGFSGSAPGYRQKCMPNKKNKHKIYSVYFLRAT